MPPRKKRTTTKKSTVAKKKVVVSEDTTTSPKMTTEPIGEIVEGPAEAITGYLKPGDDISLVLKRRKYLFAPGIRMTPDNWTAKIPEDIDPRVLQMLRTALNNEDIVKGSVHLPAFPKNKEAVKKFVQTLQKDISTFNSVVGRLAVHRGLVEGYRPYEILQVMKRYEEDVNSGRSMYTKILQEGLDIALSYGPQVRETPVPQLSADDAIKGERSLMAIPKDIDSMLK